jgi:predicted component of type VI protein secretion system
MSRIVLTFCFAALLGSCGTLSAQHTDWAQARLACADVGLDPHSSAFNECVFNLYYSLWNAQNVAER